MGKKYLETKKDSLESSILGLWQKAVEVTETNKNDKSDDGEGLDAVQPKAVKKKFKDRKDKDIDNDGDVDDSDKFLHKRRKAISKAVSKEENELDEGGMKRIATGGKNPLGGFKKKPKGKKEEIEEEISELDDLIKELDEGILGNIAKATGKTLVKGVKAGGKKVGGAIKKKVGGSKIGKAYGKVKSGIKKTKEVGGKIKKAVKTGKAYGDEYDPMLERLEIIETKLNDYYEILEEFELEKVDLDDNVEEYAQTAHFKIQSMKAALAKVWGMEEGHNPFAEHKGTKPHKHPHEENEKEVVKNGKTETGKKPATIDLKPKLGESVELTEGRMKELHGYISQGKSAKEISKIMKVDVKTIKALMDQYESTTGDSMKENGKYMEMLAAACGAASTSRPPGTGPAA